MILVINGSPNKDSKTLELTKAILEDNKEQVKFINTYNINVESCDDCKYCSSKVGCIKKDDMNQIYDLLEETNTLIISSPVYFGALSDKTLAVINRFQRYFGQKFDLKDNNIPKIDNVIFVNTAGSKKKRMFRGLKETSKILSFLFNSKYNKNLFIGNSDHVSPLSTKKAIKQINDIKKRLIN